MNTLITMPSVNQFTAYGVGNFPTSMQKIVIDSGITPIAEHFDSPQSYKQTLQFALDSKMLNLVLNLLINYLLGEN